MATWIEAWGAAGGAYNAFQLRMVLERIAVDAPSNRSLIRSSVWLHAGAGYFSGLSTYHLQGISGQTVLNATLARSVSAGGNALVMQNSIWVTHDANGYLTVNSGAVLSNSMFPSGLSVSVDLVVDRITPSTPPPTQVPQEPAGAPVVSSSGLTVTAGTAQIASSTQLLEIGYAWRPAGGSWRYVYTSNVNQTARAFTAVSGQIEVMSRGRNAAGWGPYSAVRAHTVASPPGQVPAITISASEARRLDTTWEAPSTGGAPILRYETQRCDGGTWGGIRDNGAERSYSVPGLWPGTAYRVRVRAVNAVGAGPWQESADAISAACPCGT